jgi:hypothetical protein
MQKSAITLIGIMVLAAALLGAKAFSTEKSATGKRRSFTFIYQVHVPGASDGGVARLWIPLPQSDEHQTVRNLVIESPVALKWEGKNYSNNCDVRSQRRGSHRGYDATVRFK